MVNLKNEENLDITLITEKVTRRDHIVSSICLLLEKVDMENSALC